MSFKALASALDRAITASHQDEVRIVIIGGLGEDAPLIESSHGRFTVVSNMPKSQFLREKSLRSDAEMQGAVLEEEEARKNKTPEPMSDVDREWAELTHFEEVEP
jgi:hypothetical protein